MVFPTLKRLLTQKQSNQDFSKYLGEVPQTRKQRLLEDCKKNDVSIYIDNQSEQSSGNSAELRGVGKLLPVGSRMCIGGCFWFVPRKMVSLQKKSTLALLSAAFASWNFLLIRSKWSERSFPVHSLGTSKDLNWDPLIFSAIALISKSGVLRLQALIVFGASSGHASSVL